MKKLLALLLALLLVLGTTFAENPADIDSVGDNEAETESIDASEETDKQKALDAMLTQNGTEDEMYIYKYINRHKEYTVSIPIHWAIIGIDSTADQLENASVILENTDYNPYELQRQISEENDILICISKDSRGLVLTYGESTFLSNSDMISSMGDIEKQLLRETPGIKFISEDCGSYSFRSMENILRLHMTNNGADIDQYFLITGSTMYIFTFYGATDKEKDAVFAYFYTEIVE